MNFQQHPNEAGLISSERAVRDFKAKNTTSVMIYSPLCC